jgi:hypothetical protein
LGVEQGHGRVGHVAYTDEPCESYNPSRGESEPCKTGARF